MPEFDDEDWNVPVTRLSQLSPGVHFGDIFMPRAFFEALSEYRLTQENSSFLLWVEKGIVQFEEIR